MPGTSTILRLSSGPEIILESLGHDRWTASVTLTASFPAADVEDAEECGLQAMVAVAEKTLEDLRDTLNDLACRKTTF
jgi:hypothetical protein